MTDLIDTTEMVLRTILELEEEGIVPMRARIAERLEHYRPDRFPRLWPAWRSTDCSPLSLDRHLELTGRGRQKDRRG